MLVVQDFTALLARFRATRVQVALSVLEQHQDAKHVGVGMNAVMEQLLLNVLLENTALKLRKDVLIVLWATILGVVQVLAVHVQWAQHAITLPHLQFNAPQDITGQKAVMGYQLA